MVAPVDPETGLVRVLAEFWLLPDLLALAEPGDSPPASWADLLARQGYTIDHIEDDDVQSDPDDPDPDLAPIMSDDTWRLARWLELIGPNGLTAEGRAVASVADYASESRTEYVWRPVEDVIANQITRFYLGANGRPIADLLLAGARTLWDARNHEWVSLAPGLLLVEIEALLYLAFADPQRAVDLSGRLAQNRAEAMRGAAPPLPGINASVRLVNMAVHADSVARYYLDDLSGFVNDAVLTCTAAQATSMLLVFCDLLWPPFPEYPVQYLSFRGVTDD